MRRYDDITSRRDTRGCLLMSSDDDNHQAMDRAHRLGQTKVVTVYRLVTNGTIEERILMRAKEKHEIQSIVIAGGKFKPDQGLKNQEVVSLLLDDAEVEENCMSGPTNHQPPTNNNQSMCI
jgi:hypothetical protein